MEVLLILNRAPTPAQTSTVRRLLTHCAALPETTDDTVCIGDVMDARPQLAAICRMDAVIFVPPFLQSASFHQVRLRGGRIVEMVWPLPVYAAEAEHACSFGVRALVRLFADQRIDVTDLARAPADCTGPTPSVRGAK